MHERAAYVFLNFFRRLARWVNAPTTGLDFITQVIQRNHQVGQVRVVIALDANCVEQGVRRGRWHLSVKSYRSTLCAVPGNVRAERNLCALTMNGAPFVAMLLARH